MESVSVVIVTRDRRAELERTLARLARLPARPPVIVVDNGSTDGTREALAQRGDVRLVALHRDEGAAGRTAGVLAARTPYVAFSDDDSWWAPGALARGAELLDAHPSVALLAARVLLPGGRPDPVCDAMAASPLPPRPGLPGPRVLGFIACGAVVRRDAYLAAGGFPAGRGIGGEERPLAAALADRGWDLVYVPELLAHHHPSTRRDPGRRAAVNARNDLLTAWTVLPAAAALRATAAALAHPSGAFEALRALPAALRARAPVGPRTAAELARLA
jgi:GT2 family glycosyltransferase